MAIGPGEDASFHHGSIVLLFQDFLALRNMLLIVENQKVGMVNL